MLLRLAARRCCQSRMVAKGSGARGGTAMKGSTTKKGSRRPAHRSMTRWWRRMSTRASSSLQTAC